MPESAACTACAREELLFDAEREAGIPGGGHRGGVLHASGAGKLPSAAPGDRVCTSTPDFPQEWCRYLQLRHHTADRVRMRRQPSACTLCGADPPRPAAQPDARVATQPRRGKRSVGHHRAFVKMLDLVVVERRRTDLLQPVKVALPTAIGRARYQAGRTVVSASPNERLTAAIPPMQVSAKVAGSMRYS